MTQRARRVLWVTFGVALLAAGGWLATDAGRLELGLLTQRWSGGEGWLGRFGDRRVEGAATLRDVPRLVEALSALAPEGGVQTAYARIWNVAARRVRAAPPGAFLKLVESCPPSVRLVLMRLRARAVMVYPGWPPPPDLETSPRYALPETAEERGELDPATRARFEALVEEGRAHAATLGDDFWGWFKGAPGEWRATWRRAPRAPRSG